MFTDVDLFGWSAVAAEFVECMFQGRLRDCKFWGKQWGTWSEPGNLRPARRSNAFMRNYFISADLEAVSFVGGINLGD